jgi:hypothetical protein
VRRALPVDDPPNGFMGHTLVLCEGAQRFAFGSLLDLGPEWRDVRAPSGPAALQGRATWPIY